MHQDWPTWLNEGWVDAVFPMLYTDDNKLFLEQLMQLSAAVPKAKAKAKVLPVLGVYKHKSIEKTLQQIDIAEDAGYQSLGFYSYNSFYPSAAASPASEAAIKEQRRRELVPALISRKVFGTSGAR